MRRFPAKRIGGAALGGNPRPTLDFTTPTPDAAPAMTAYQTLEIA